MKIVTWNVNSINVRLQALVSWLKEHKPDVMLLQELKCETERFPREPIEELGYNLAIHGQKALNGVAILSLSPIDEFTTQFPNNPVPHEARYIEAVISLKGSSVRVASIYVPNGDTLESPRYQTKLQFLDALTQHCHTLLDLDEEVCIGGDFNVAPDEMDVYDPDRLRDSVVFEMQVRQKFRSILNLGFYNAFRLMHPKEQQFSWWDYRANGWQRGHGMLLDHLLLTPNLADKLESSEIDKDMRGSERASDHVPVIGTFNRGIA